jgi:hypothetical protein
VRRLILVLATMGVAVLLASGAALGITNGNPDTNAPYRYPYVGALVDEGGAYCTGTLISPTVLLTAAHCYPWVEGDPSYVACDPSYTIDKEESDAIRECKRDPRCTSHWTEITSETEYSGEFIDDDTYDIAVVKFDEPGPLGDNPANLPQLPTRHLLNEPTLVLNDTTLKSLNKGDPFTAVGYGANIIKDQGPWLEYKDRREWGVSKFNSLGRTYLRLSQKDSGGTCYGDSGGPNFLGTYPYEYDYKSNLLTDNVPVIAGTTITGDSWCQTTNVTLRLDIDATRTFLKPYGVLPDPDAQ